MAFQFRLHTILKLRQAERDQQRRFVQAARVDLAKAREDGDRLATERRVIMIELRDINRQESWALDQVQERKRHAEQLGQAITSAEAVVREASDRLERLMAALVKSDQAVKVLERLCERRLEDDLLKQKQQNALNGFTS